MKAVVLLRATVDPEIETLALDGPSIAALCQALEWRKASGAHLSGLAAGPKAWEAPLRDALALGLDAAERVATPDGEWCDVAWTATALVAALPADTGLIFAGAHASDSGSGALPAALAGILDWPLVADVVRANDASGSLVVETAGGAGLRRTFRVSGPAVLVAAPLPPPPVYAPLARRLAAGRATIEVREPDAAALPAPGRFSLLSYGPGRPRTKHLLKPSSAARPGDRISQLMAGGPQRSSSRLSGDSADLARQLIDLLASSGLLTR
jgi:electron transfer flavoprotein alpha/beta subunit